MKKIITVLIVTILLTALLSGCTIINGIFGNSAIGVPTKIEFDENTGALTWNAVKKADSYDVLVTVSGVDKAVHCDEPYLELDISMVGEITVKVRANKGSKSGEYSEAVSIKYIAPLNIDGKSVRAEYYAGSLKIDWADVNHADGYKLKYTYNGDTVELTVEQSEYTITDYISSKTCDIEIYALGSGNYRNGKTATYRFLGVADYDDIKGTVTIDMIDGEDAVFAIQGITKAILDKTEDVTAKCELNGSFTIPFESLEDIEVGEHTLTLTDSEETVVYKLIISDTRAPEIIVDEYTKDGEDLMGTVKTYRNTIGGLYFKGSVVGSDAYRIDKDSITFYAEYLDSMPDGKVVFELRYTTIDGGENKNIDIEVVVSSKVAVIEKMTYDYSGEDIAIDIKTNGDKVSYIKLGDVTLDEMQYSASPNKLIVYKQSFEDNSGNLEIHTVKGGNFTIKINYKVDGFCPDKSLYAFDKSSPSDIVINGKTNVDSLSVFGNSLTPAEYTYSNGQIVMYKSYLSSLDSGVYKFFIYANDIVSPYTIKVHASKGDIYNVRLNYDLSSVDEYITFNCDCVDGTHTYVLDDQAKLNCENMTPVTVNRSASHTLTVYCQTLGKSAEYSITPTVESSKYLNSFFTVNGVASDKYIDSPEEFATLMQFIANGGDGVTINDEYPDGFLSVDVYFSDSFSTYVKNTSTYFQDAIDEIETSTSCKYGLQSSGSKVTISVIFNYNPDSVISSGMEEEKLLDNTIKLTESTRTEDYNDFAINSFTRTEKVATLGELEFLSYGVKPTFVANSVAEKVYNEALDILRTYVDDSMSDYQKVTAIYDYLVSNITYDRNALELFMVRSNVSGRSLSDARSIINQAISDNPQLKSILSPYLKYTDSEKLYKDLSYNVSSLSAFNIYGALVNKIAVCDGISSAFKLLCNIEGIECIKVSGLGITSSGSENHAWNKVKLLDEWFVVDATWGRSSGYINHRYFLIDEADASVSHRENCDSNYYSVVETPAEGNIEFYNSGLANVYYASSREEFKTIVSQLQAKNVTQIEIKLDYDFIDLESEVKALNIKCSYYKYDNILKIILK